MHIYPGFTLPVTAFPCQLTEENRTMSMLGIDSHACKCKALGQVHGQGRHLVFVVLGRWHVFFQACSSARLRDQLLLVQASQGPSLPYMSLGHLWV